MLINIFPINANTFCDAEQVLISRSICSIVYISNLWYNEDKIMHEQALSKFKKISNERRFNGVKSRLIKVDMCQIFSESNQVHEM